MRAQGPEHAFYIVDRVTLDRDAAHDDDAAALLELVEYKLEVGVERRMAAILGHDLGDLALVGAMQHVLERRRVARSQVEGDVVLCEVAAAPGHLMAGRHAVDRGHGNLPPGFLNFMPRGAACRARCRRASRRS